MDEVNILFRSAFDKKTTVKDLRALCKQKGIKGYSSLKRVELIELLGNNDNSKKKQPVQITLFGEKVSKIKPKKKIKVIPIFDRIHNNTLQVLIEKHPISKFYWCKDLNIIFDDRISFPENARRKDDRQVMIATGYFSDNGSPLPLDIYAIDRCKENNIPYEIPEIIIGYTASKDLTIEYNDSDDSDLDI